LVAKVAQMRGDDAPADDATIAKCSLISEKLNALLETLKEESSQLLAANKQEVLK
jgi:hypothetical protein